MHIKLTGNGPAAAPILINTDKVLAYTTHYTVSDSPSSRAYSEVVFGTGTSAGLGVYVKETVEEISALIDASS
tara:strand:+ start:1328 stop:1546 length:219 start_codon:yes stop_codon:yes gene_type:complete